MKLNGVIIWLVINCMFCAEVFSQSKIDIDSIQGQIFYLKSGIFEGDTIPHILLDEVKVIPRLEFTSRRELNRYNRLVRNVKATLPYARVAAEKLREIDEAVENIDNDRERRRYVRDAERELFSEFEQPLRRLTFTQGRLLIRLIDRETGDTSYSLIRDYKGGVPAFFWQGIARIFGANLKDEYDPERDDKMVEHIIELIDMGIL